MRRGEDRVRVYQRPGAEWHLWCAGAENDRPGRSLRQLPLYQRGATMKRNGVQCPVALDGAELLRGIPDRGDGYSHRIEPDIRRPGHRPGGPSCQSQAAMEVAHDVPQLFLKLGQEELGARYPTCPSGNEIPPNAIPAAHCRPPISTAARTNPGFPRK